jgi:hypothetical protein
MLVDGTPVEHHPDLGLMVKREDLACRPPGPQFSKTRGVFSHVEKCVGAGFVTFGALDTYHSQAGHAVARACQLLGVKCVNFYPEYKHEPGPRDPQRRAAELGADLWGMPAGMSAVLYHQAVAKLARLTDGKGYMMPNALKLDESVEETAREVSGDCLTAQLVIVPISSATIAAGVIAGFQAANARGEIPFLPEFVLHLGYSRSHEKVLSYLAEKLGGSVNDLPIIHLVDEKYNYKDKARGSGEPPFPCSPYYDLKAYRWWVREGRQRFSRTDSVLLWNIG